MSENEDSDGNSQEQFNGLPNDEKVDRLNSLIQQAQVYSRIILDNMLEKSMEKKKIQDKVKRVQQRERRREHEKKKQLVASGEMDENQLSSDPEAVEDSEPEPEEPEQIEEPEEPEEASEVEITEIRPQRRKTRSSGKAMDYSLESDDEIPERKRRKTKSTKGPKSSKHAKSKTRAALENAQTAHNQTQPRLVSGCSMKDYQLDGLEWLVSLYENGLNGILADEMGLGKTLQCISLMCYLLEHKVRDPFLVVAPLSTVENWCREFSRFAPNVKVLKYVGPKEERAKIKLGKSIRRTVVVTSYEVVMKDFRRFGRQNWSYLTVDEGHRLKNFECQLIRHLKRLNTANRLLLTGTPLQNNLNELWSLLNFILPDIFHDLDLFASWFDFDAIGDDAAAAPVLKSDMQQKLVSSLHSILKPFLLRRLKKDVVQTLPPKKEYILYADLTPLQRVVYAGAAKGNLPETILEVYAKEYFLHHHPELFSKKDHLRLISEWLNDTIDVDAPEEDPRLLRRRRNQRYSSKTISFIQGSGDGLGESDNEFSDPGPSSPPSPPSESSLDHRARDLEKSLQMEIDGIDDFEMSLQRELDGAIAAAGPGAEMGPNEPNEANEVNPPNQPNPANPANPENPENPENQVDQPENDLKADKPNGIKKKSNLNVKTEEPNLNVEIGKPNLNVETGKPNLNVEAEIEEVQSSPEPTSPETPEAEVIEIIDDEDLTEEERRKAIFDVEISNLKQQVKYSALHNVVMQLRKVCGSHYTFYNPCNDEDGDEALAKLLIRHSSKLAMLMQLLRRLVKENHKVLVFSQFTLMLNLIAVLLDQEQFSFSQLDGTYSQSEREEQVQAFFAKNDVFLLSTRAGGLGLNLAAADTVILFDNDWNPQMDLQAIDRAHRIGQIRPVKVFRLVVRNTVEELLVMRSFSKRLLERMVIALGQFHMGRVAKKLANEKIDLSKIKSLSALLHLGSRLDLYGAHETEFTLDSVDEILFSSSFSESPLSEKEISELMDRSNECYQRGATEIAFENVTTFESSASDS